MIAIKAPIDSPTFTGTVRGITKEIVDLANVNDTRDFNKPISNATNDALDTKQIFFYSERYLQQTQVDYLIMVITNLELYMLIVHYLLKQLMMLILLFKQTVIPKQKLIIV